MNIIAWLKNWWRHRGWDEYQQMLAEECAGILRGRISVDFEGCGPVSIELTMEERGVYLAAILRAIASKRSIARYFSPEFEKVAFGGTPDRYEHQTLPHALRDKG